MQEISQRQVRRLLFKTDAHLVDVLPKSEFIGAHLPSAINIPYGEDFGCRVQSAVPDINTPVIVYSASSNCELSLLAAQELDRVGYTKVFEYRAGKADWQQAGLQVERGAATQSPPLSS